MINLETKRIPRLGRPITPLPLSRVIVELEKKAN